MNQNLENKKILKIKSSCNCQGWISNYTRYFTSNRYKKDFELNKFLDEIKEFSNKNGDYTKNCVIEEITQIYDE